MNEHTVLAHLTDWNHVPRDRNSYLGNLVRGIISNYPTCCVHAFCLDDLTHPDGGVAERRRDTVGYEGTFMAWDPERWVPTISEQVDVTESISVREAEMQARERERRPGWSNYVPCRECAEAHMSDGRVEKVIHEEGERRVTPDSSW